MSDYRVWFKDKADGAEVVFRNATIDVVHGVISSRDNGVISDVRIDVNRDPDH